MKKFKIENYNDYIKYGVVSFETAKIIAPYFTERTDLSYYSREALKEDVSEEYKKYEDWYPHEIRSELGNKKANSLLENVWGLHTFNSVNGEYDNVYSAPLLQQCIDFIIKKYNIVLGIFFITNINKWVFTYQPLETGTYYSNVEFDTWQEALDFGIRSVVINK